MPARRRPTRWLAPLAIVAVAATGYGIARSAGRSSDDSDDRPRTTASPRSRRPTTDADGARARPRRTYIVQSRRHAVGDLARARASPSSASQQLNPDLDAQALQPGQQLKLPPVTTRPLALAARAAARCAAARLAGALAPGAPRAAAAPSISAPRGDPRPAVDRRRRLRARRATQRRPIASTTKLMTALLTLERAAPVDDVITAAPYAAAPAESVAGPARRASA